MNYMMYDMMNDIKYYRDQLGLKQEELAHLVNVSRNTIGSIENGKTLPSIYLAFLIADELQVPVERLFFYEYEGVKCTPFHFRCLKQDELKAEKNRELHLFDKELPFT